MRDRGLGQTLSRTGLGFGPAELMSKVNEWLRDPELLMALAGVGGAVQGETNRLQLDAYARAAVREVLAEETKLEENRPALQVRYGKDILAGLEAHGLDTASGRTLVQLEALLSGRDPLELAHDLAADPNQLALTRKEEQYLRLAQQGRFDVTDPQFSEELYFMPYRALWDQVSPETRQALAEGQQRWAQVAQHWGQVLRGERPSGPAPADWWGARGAALEHVERQTFAELEELWEGLRSGRAEGVEMGERLERLTVYRDALGADRFDAVVQQALGPEGGKVGEWLSFRDQFVDGKRNYWQKLITAGQAEADRWDADLYQPLRAVRNEGLADPVYGPLVQAIQAEALAVHEAYAALYQAKSGWWTARRAGRETTPFAADAADARQRLSRLDPEGEGLWGHSAPAWHLDQQQKSLWELEQAQRPERQQAGARAAESAAELRAKIEQLQVEQPEWGAMIPHADLIWKMSQKHGLQAEIIAAKIFQESRGNPAEDAGRLAGKGLMQIEFGAHRESILPGASDKEKLAWIMEPENNLEYGTTLLKSTLDQWIEAYGTDEGLKRGLQYWNYGPGAAAWVEAHSKSPADWQYWVDKYHDTHQYDRDTGKWYEVESGGGYGTPQHWRLVHGHYTALMGVALPSISEGTRIYDGSKPAEETTDRRVWEMVEAPLTNEVGQRRQPAYLDVVDQFAVAHNPRYTPRDTSGDGLEDTFCNIFVWDVTRAMGAEIPHWVTDGRIPAKRGDPDATELNANATLHWLAAYGDEYGWREVTAVEAQAWANAGKPAVAAWDSGTGSPGHIAMVIPGEHDAAKGPAIAQAGGTNYNRATVREGFGAKRMEAVRYYVHD